MISTNLNSKRGGCNLCQNCIYSEVVETESQLAIKCVKPNKYFPKNMYGLCMPKIKRLCAVACIDFIEKSSR